MSRFRRISLLKLIQTGSSSGLGRAIALRFAAEGANICCADLTPHVPTNAEESHTHDAITAAHGSGRSIFVKADVTSGSDLEAAVKECVKAFGRLDIVVPSAGIAREASQSGLVKCHEVSDDFFDLVIAINLKGVFLTCKYAIAQMLKQEPLPGADRGWVINIASIAGLIAFEGACEYPNRHCQHPLIGLFSQLLHFQGWRGANDKADGH